MLQFYRSFHVVFFHGSSDMGLPICGLYHFLARVRRRMLVCRFVCIRVLSEFPRFFLQTKNSYSKRFLD